MIDAKFPDLFVAPDGSAKLALTSPRRLALLPGTAGLRGDAVRGCVRRGASVCVAVPVNPRLGDVDPVLVSVRRYSSCSSSFRFPADRIICQHVGKLGMDEGWSHVFVFVRRLYLRQVVAEKAEESPTCRPAEEPLSGAPVTGL